MSRRFAVSLGFLLAAPLGAQVVTLAPEIVTATRTPQPPAHTAVTVRVVDDLALRQTPSLTLDGQLRALPAFSLFRRSDSFSANPSSQGVSLRGLGPSGASRTLVLLDGVPLNDPFGGWVAWSKVPRENLLRVEVIPGGGATAWGDAALGGIVQMLGRRPTAREGSITALLGDHGTRSVEFTHTQPGGDARLDVAARVFSTDGFPLVAPERRGSIDVDAWSRHRWASLRWRQPLGATTEFSAAFRAYEEKRGNGTPYQGNTSSEAQLSFALAGHPSPAFAWNATAYAQDQSFSSTFSSVNATRAAETPASDQFAVPATAFGASWIGSWNHAAARTSVGADLRHVRGETREHYLFAAGDFARRRVAGGRQWIGGLFALHERPLGPDLRGTLGARLDRWSDADGHRRESDRATGAFFRDESYASRDGSEFHPSAGLVWRPAGAWRWRAHVQRAFRLPTLNELYRPFRVGANVTESNASLRPEHVTSAELGAEVGLGRLYLGATAFWNDFRDAVGNVTIARGPGTFPIVGTIAAGGVGRQKLNLDRLRVQGLELSARWAPSPGFTLTGDLLINDPTVRRASPAPALVGRRIAQVPRHSGALGAVWRAPGGLTVSPRVRYLGRQYEDDENQLTLGAVVIADLTVSRPLSPRVEVFLTAENLGAARIETGRSASGLVNTGTPRLVVGGLRGRW